MNLLLRSVTVSDPNSPVNQKQTDIFINDGVITKIGKSLKIKDKHNEIDCSNLFISPGWIDIHCSFCDPGFEHKEDIDSGVRAAAAGGFTAVAIMPDTSPVLHSKPEIEYILNRSKDKMVDVFPIGAITRKHEGKELAELYDMFNAGAVAFSDAGNPVADSGVMMRALEYVKIFDGVVFSHPYDADISFDGSMNEGEVSTRLGLKGMPALAEELMVVRDIYLAEYTNSRVHFSMISTARSVELIRNAKKRGIKVTCGVSSLHLSFDDSHLNEFDSNYKLNPPLRTRADIAALKTGLKDGTIDVIVSAHQPQNIEQKDVEFEYAGFGAINLQTTFSLALNALGKNFPIEKLIEKMAVTPREILKLNVPVIAEDQPANFTIFSNTAEWSFNESTNLSKSFNSPLKNKTLTGKARYIFNNKQFQNL